MPAVNRTDRFNRCLIDLRQGGGDAAIAANRAERLIRELSLDSGDNLKRRWKTNNGEARIDGCRKFYIGHRFRLISILQENQILLTFAGTHDACDRWIEKHRGRDFSSPAHTAAECAAALPAVATADAPHQDPTIPGPETDYDAYLREQFSEREIRTFFSELFTASTV